MKDARVQEEYEVSGRCLAAAARHVRRCYVVAAAASHPLSSRRRVQASAAAAAAGPIAAAAPKGLSHYATGTLPRDERVKRVVYNND